MIHQIKQKYSFVSGLAKRQKVKKRERGFFESGLAKRKRLEGGKEGLNFVAFFPALFSRSGKQYIKTLL
jgi:hypothetical protein